MRLLLAEDELGFSDALVAVLEHNNYSVDAVYDGEDAYCYGIEDVYDGILLDIMMPKMDGLTVLKKLRERGVTTPILLLTAKGEVEDRIEGLNCGADDYLPKPFVMGELIARVGALTRRKGAYNGVNNGISVSCGNVTLNTAEYTISTEHKSARLGAKEFQLFEYLMMNQHQVISAEQFIRKIWGFDAEVEINVVWVNLSNIRKKLTDIGADIEIRAVRGVGYTLEVTGISNKGHQVT